MPRCLMMIATLLVTAITACAGADVQLPPQTLTGHPEAMQAGGLRDVLALDDITREGDDETAAFRQRIDVPADWADRVVHLWIDDAWPGFDLHIDGEPVARYAHSDHVPGSIEITDHLRPGKTAEIALHFWPESAIMDGERYVAPAGESRVGEADAAALLGHVYLIATAPQHVRALQVEVDVAGRTVELTGDVTADGLDGLSVDVSLYEVGVHRESRLVFEPRGDVVRDASAEVTEGGFALALPFPEDATLWRPDRPFLYLFRTELRRDGRTVDVFDQRIGLRSFGIDGPHFTLNGNRFLGRMVFGSYTHDNGGWDVDAVHEFLTRLQHRNFNLYRTHGWPRSRYVMLMADQLGLPIIAEAAVPFGRNYPIQQTDHVFWNHYRDHVDRLTRQLAHHPAIVLWSAENELLSQPRIVDRSGEIHEQLVAIHDRFKANDPTRPVMFEGDLDLRGHAAIINEHYPKRYGNYNWPNDFYWVGEPHVPNQADGQQHDGEIRWQRDKPYVFGETMWFPTGGPVRHTAFVGDRMYENWIRYPYDSWHAHGLSRHAIAARAYNLQDVTAFVTQTSTALLDHIQFDLNAPLGVFVKQEHRHYYGGATLERDLVLCNALYDEIDVQLQVHLTIDGRVVRRKTSDYALPAGTRVPEQVLLELPEVADVREAELVFDVLRAGEPQHRYTQTLKLYPREARAHVGDAEVALYDPPGHTAEALRHIGVTFRRVGALTDRRVAEADLLVIGESALTGDVPDGTQDVMRLVERGGGVLVLAQDAEANVDWLPGSLSIDRDRSATMAHMPTTHPLFARRGLVDGDLFWWRGDHRVARHTYQRPTDGHSTVLAEVGSASGLTHAALIESRFGEGRLLLSQLLCIERANEAPPARELLIAAVEDLVHRRTRTGTLAVVGPVSEAIRDRLERVGARYQVIDAEQLTGQLLRPHTTLLIPPSEEVWTKVTRHVEAVRHWVYHEGGQVILHRVTPPLRAAVDQLVQPRAVVLREMEEDVPLYKRSREERYGRGLSNELLWWIPSNTTSYSTIESGLKEPMIDHQVLPHPDRSYGHGGWQALTEPAGLTRLTSGAGVYLFDQLRWDVNDAELDKQLGYLRWLLGSMDVALDAGRSEADLSQATSEVVDLRRFAARGLKDDPDKGGGAGWFGLGPQLDVRAMEPGDLDHRGVPLRVIDPSANRGRAMIVLHGRRGESFPREVGPVPVRARADYLVFHHASAYAEGGETLGTYEVRYREGHVERVPIVEGRHVRDWYQGPARLVDAQTAWSGPTQRGVVGATFAYVWTNPRPQSPIESVTLHAGEGGRTGTEGVLQHGMLGVLSITAVRVP